MGKKVRQIVSLFMASSMMLLTACGNGATTETSQGAQGVTEEKATEEKATKETEGAGPEKEEPVVIRFGTGDPSGNDPEYKDPVTGEYKMSEANREKHKKILGDIKEQLNVELEFVHYGDVSEVLLQSVMAGDPICDVARIYTMGEGTVLRQNVLQPLNDYEEYFGDNPPPKILGNYYFVYMDGDNKESYLPLMYNIDYIEAVDTLKVDGRTVYPTDLYKEGKWTWNTFKEYLKAIDVFYTGSQAPERPEQRIQAYWASWADTYKQAIYSAGGSIYGREGLGITSDATKKAVGYMQELIESKLMYMEGEGRTNEEIMGGRLAIERGESVFGHVEDYKTGRYSNKLAETGQSLGYVPFPRPDYMDANDPNYMTAREPGDTYAILKGVEEEKIPYAIQATRMYLEECVAYDEAEFGKKPRIAFDIFHEEVGQDMVDIYWERANKTVVNDLAGTVKLQGFSALVGDALYGVNGSSSYDVAVEAKLGTFQSQLDDLKSALSQQEPIDNIPPVFTQIEPKTYAYPVGTDGASIDWKSEFTVADNVDGALDINNATFDMAGTDFATPGEYPEGMVASISDAVGNTRTSKYKIIVFDAQNKVAPVVTLKEEPRKLKVEEDTSKINWGKDFVETAVDSNGIDLKAFIKPDLTQLDTTTAGEYVVPLTVTDYAGNEVTVEVKVIVE